MKHNLLLLIAVMLAAPPAMAGEDGPLRTITVSGEASEELSPDRAVLSGQLVSKAKQLPAAKEANDKQAERVLAVAKQFDIPADKVAASNVMVMPDYIYNNKTNKQEQVGYVVSRSLSITMDKLAIHEAVLSALVENGIDQVNSVSFDVAQPEAHRDALRVKAVQNAKARAQKLAEAAGAKLGKVIAITMGGAMPPPMPMMMRGAMARSDMMEKSSVAPSLPGLERLQESVTVTFELE